MLAHALSSPRPRWAVAYDDRVPSRTKHPRGSVGHCRSALSRLAEGTYSYSVASVRIRVGREALEGLGCAPCGPCLTALSPAASAEASPSRSRRRPAITSCTERSIGAAAARSNLILASEDAHVHLAERERFTGVARAGSLHRDGVRLRSCQPGQLLGLSRLRRAVPARGRATRRSCPTNRVLLTHHVAAMSYYPGLVVRGRGPGASYGWGLRCGQYADWGRCWLLAWWC
jgi:hypothetical protein